MHSDWTGWAVRFDHFPDVGWALSWKKGTYSHNVLQPVSTGTCCCSNVDLL